MDRCLLMFIIGVGLSLNISSAGTFWWSCAAVSLALAVILVSSQALPRARLLAMLVLSVFCGIALTTANLNWQHYQRKQVDELTETTQVKLLISSIPEQYATHSRFVGTVLSITGKQQTFLNPPKIQASWYGNFPRQLKLGQLWLLKVKFKQAQNYWNEGSRDYRLRLSRQGIIALASVTEGHLIEQSNNIRARLAQRFADDANRYNGVLAALSIGVRSFLTAEDRRQWQHNGLTHALAISGLHLSLVGWAGLMLGRVLLSRIFCLTLSVERLEKINIKWLSLLLALLIATGYAWLADFAIATVRALIMFSVIVLHQVLALRVSSWQLLLRTAALLFVIDPLAWLDAGFWLSVTALGTIFSTLWRWQQGPEVNPAYQLFRLQLMFLLVMAPLSLYWFGGVSLLAPLVNLLFLPVISCWILPFTLLGSLSELVYAHTFADNLWYMATLPLMAVTPVLQETASWSFTWWQPKQPVPLPALLSLLLIVMTPISKRLVKWLLAVSVPLTITALADSRERDSNIKLHVLDVGQSQAVVIERAGRAWLVDTGMGYSSGYTLAATVIEPFLQARNLQLEGVWVSHKDRDHSGGVAYLKQHYSDIAWFGALTNRPCQRGMQGNWNNINWSVLWPSAEPIDEVAMGSNNQSCVLLFRYKDFSLLLPGDIEFPAERQIAEKHGFPSVDVLVAAHHGSKTSSGWLKLKQTQPSIILISNGEHKGFNFPHRYTTERFRTMVRPWFNTKDVGQLTVVSDGYRWHLELPFAAKRERLIYTEDD